MMIMIVKVIAMITYMIILIMIRSIIRMTMVIIH